MTNTPEQSLTRLLMRQQDLLHLITKQEVRMTNDCCDRSLFWVSAAGGRYLCYIFGFAYGFQAARPIRSVISMTVDEYSFFNVMPRTRVRP